MPRRIYVVLCILGLAHSGLAGALAPAGSPSVVVDTTSDSLALQACSAAPGDCSLRGALARTQRDLPGEDTIHFDIPPSDANCNAAGVCTITLSTDSIDLASLVPGIQTGPSQGFTIDGYTQPGASANTLPLGQGSNAQPRIKLVGPVGTARQITTHTPFTIRGLIFQNIALIHQRGDDGFGANGHPTNLRYEIYGNFFGYDADGVTGLDSPSLGGTAYVRVTNLIRGVRVGSGDPADINLFGAGAQKPNFCLIILGENRVQGNFIGTDRSGISGSGCLNGLQVSHQASPNRLPLDIGGAAPGQGNVIANHVLNAIDIIPAERDVLVRIRGNKIGIGVDGVTPAPNFNAGNSVCAPFAAIRGGFAQPGSAQIGGLAPGEGNLFGPNGRNRGRCPAPFAAPAPYMQTVASGEGMGVWQVQGNRYLGLEGMAIDLVQTNDTNNSQPQRLPNDADDADPLGANRRQNFPVISAFGLVGDQVSLTYRVDSTPANSRYPLSIEFLKDDGQGNLTPIGHDTYSAVEAQTDKAISFALPAGISLGASDIVIATATTTGDSTPGENISGETSETSFYPLESFSLVSITPTTTPSGVPVMVRVRAVAAPGVPFKPNGRVLVQASDGSSPFEECTALLAPVAAARTSEGECQVGITAPPGSVGVRVSYNAAQNSFALADGRHPDSVLQLVTVTPGATALELVSGDNQATPVGEAFVAPLVVRAVGAGGATFAGVPVQFSGPAAGAGASFDPATAVSDADGLASTTATAIRAGGSYSVTARVGALTQSFSLTNEPGLDTALEIISHLPNPSVPGQTVTVTTALNPAAGGPGPSGSIAVTANTGEACSIALPATSCLLTFANVGERVIQAFYPGDADYRSSKAAFADQSVVNLPSMSINNVSLNEGNAGNSEFVFTVTLQNPSGAAVSVDFATANDSAAAPGDYAASNGTLNFAGSTTTQTVTVQVVGDTTVEPDERFFVNLSNASGATIADAQGSGSILDDDQPPPPAASIDDVIVQEPVLRGITQTRARFTVGLDRPAPGLVSLRVRTQGGTAMQNQDFDGNDFILRFNAGQRERLVDVFIHEDDLPELTENFFVELSDPQGLTIADALGEASILDDGPDAALTVNSAADPGDGNCTPGDCTLREAILRANTLQSVRIGFDIPGVGPHTILLDAPLPNLGDRIHTVDGYTQPGSRPNAVAISDNRDLDADQRIVIDAGGIGGSALNLQHGGTIRGLRLQRLGLNVLHRLNARPTRIVGNHLSEAGVSIRPDGASSDALVDILIGGEGADRNRLGNLGFSSNNSGLRPGTRVRIEGNVIDARIAITDDNSNGIRSNLHLLGNRAPGVDLDPGSSVFDGINPGLQLDSSGNHYSGDPAIEVLPSNFREFGQLRFVGDRFSPGARAAVIHAHSQPGNEHRVLLVPAAMDTRADAIDLGADGPSANDVGDHDSGPNDLLNYPELLSATYNDRGERLRIRFRLEPEGVGDGYVAHFYARSDDRLEWLGARAYLGGIDEFDLTLPRRLPLGTEIHALTEFENFAGISSERSASPVAVTGNQLLAQAAATRENAGVLRFAISPEQALAAPRTLRYRSIDGSALAGSDYTAVDASIAAPAGDFELFVDVPLLNDTLVERDESFQLEVWSDEDFSLGSALATATITDDDVSRREVRQFDTLDLDALDGQRGFRIEHQRADEAVLIDLGDFIGGPGNDLALAISEVGYVSANARFSPSQVRLNGAGQVHLLPDLAPPFAPMLQLGRGTLQFPLLRDFSVEGAALLALPMGSVRGDGSRPTLGLRSNSGAYFIHGRSTPLPASSSIQSLASGVDGQTLTLPNAAERVAAIGDVNGDGREDFAISAPPRAHVLLGRNDGAPLTVSFTISAASGEEGLEILQVAGAGYLNDDGFADLIVRGRNAAGHQLWLVPGRPSFGGVRVPEFGQAEIVNPFGNGASDLAGAMEFASGPIGTGDNGQLETLVLAAPETDGGLTLLFRSSTLDDVVHSANRARISSAFPGDRTGQGLAVLPDFDGDGRSDLAVGVPGADVQRTGTGRIAILHVPLLPGGTFSLGNSGLLIQWLHGQQEQRAGWRLAALRDVDGDGRGDLGITAPTAGRSYVVFSSDVMFRTGGEERSPPPPTLQVYSSAEGPGEIPIRRSAGVYNEVELLPAGDFDGDGRGDVLIGQPSVQAVDSKVGRRIVRSASVAGEGAIALLLSSAASLPPPGFGLDGLPPGAVRIRRSEDPEQPLAVAYAAGGDYNGDGRSDLAFLAASLDQVAVVFGGIDDFLPAFLDPFREADVTLQPCGTALRLANLGDIDGDGFDDLGVLCAASGGSGPSELAIRFGSPSGFSGVSSIPGVQSLGSTPGIGRVRTDGSGADSLVLALPGGGATIVFGGAHMRSNPAALNGNTLRLGGAHLSEASAVRVVGLGFFDDLPGEDIGIAHSPTSRDGSPVGHVEILSGRASFPALLDLRNPPPGVIQGRVVLRGSGVHAITSLDSLADRNADGRRELLIGLGEAEGHAPGSGKALVLHGFALPGLGIGTALREVDDVVPIGAGLTIRNAAFANEALVQARDIGDIDGDGLEDIGFGAQTDDLRGLTARKGRLVIIRGAALPPP
jgi:CSLREA domain-containing protein